MIYLRLASVTRSLDLHGPSMPSLLIAERVQVVCLSLSLHLSLCRLADDSHFGAHKGIDRSTRIASSRHHGAAEADP